MVADNVSADSLTSRQHKGIAALIAESSIRKASESSGIPERTLYAWLKDTHFDRAYRDARRASVQQAISQIQRASGAAVAVLFSLLQATQPPAVRLAAASKVLDLALKGIELDDLAARLAALEQAYAAKL